MLFSNHSHSEKTNEAGNFLILLIAGILVLSLIILSKFLVDGTILQDNQTTQETITTPKPQITPKFSSGQKLPGTIIGKVTANDNACVVDGTCILTVQDDSGMLYKIEYGGGFSWCMKKPHGSLIDNIKLGDSVEVYAAKLIEGENNLLTLCGNKELFIKKSI